MASNILYLEEQLRDAKEAFGSLVDSFKEDAPRLYNENKCFEYIAEAYREDLATIYRQTDAGEMVIVTVRPSLSLENDLDAKISVGIGKKAKVADLYLDIAGEGDLYRCVCNLINDRFAPVSIPVLCHWVWSKEIIEALGEDFEGQPILYLGMIPTPSAFSWETLKPKPVKTPKPKNRVPEKTLEEKLLAWLHTYGLKADSQIKTSRHRMDVWIPGKCFLELKASKVSGDDVCQAIDYCVEYQKPVILVGNHISEMASRGVEAFNKAVNSEMIVFISWSGVRTYLKGLLNL